MSSRLLLIQGRANRPMNHRLHAAVTSLTEADLVACGYTEADLAP